MYVCVLLCVLLYSVNAILLDIVSIDLQQLLNCIVVQRRDLKINIQKIKMGLFDSYLELTNREFLEH